MSVKIINFIDLDTSMLASKPLDLQKYLALRSANFHNPDYHIRLHANYSPSGVFWEICRDFVELVHIKDRTIEELKHVKRIEHKADFLRLKILMESGGIYLDTDVVTLKNFDPLRNGRVVMGIQQRSASSVIGGLCNAVIITPPSADFIDLWISAYSDFHNDQWDLFSVKKPWELAQRFPELIHVEPFTTFFYPTGWPEGISALFEQNIEFPEAYVFHLWAKSAAHHLQHLSIAKIMTQSTTLNNAVRPFIWDDFMKLGSQS